jgi:predicted protein tyrosine phosphatase
LKQPDCFELERMIYVCSLHEMQDHVRALGPTHLVSPVAPGEMPQTPEGMGLHRHLRVEVHDISEPDANGALDRFALLSARCD